MISRPPLLQQHNSYALYHVAWKIHKIHFSDHNTAGYAHSRRNAENAQEREKGPRAFTPFSM